MFKHYRVIHFIGIGGIGMSGIAEVLHNLGYEITGSDIKDSDTTKRLKSCGIRVFIGHNRENISKAHLVVVSSAISSDNPEIIEAKRNSIPIIPRAEMLAELARLKYGILIAGAHGKTTTTSLIATLLGEGGLDPTVVIGGKLKALGSNAKLGQGDFLVAEADESDGSFLKLNPTIAVITNIDKEHLDYFKDIEKLKSAFLAFANKIPFYGTAVVCAENEHARDIIPAIERKMITYGFSPDSAVRASNVKSVGTTMSFEAAAEGKELGNFIIPIPGEHNVLNSLAAIAIAIELQIPVPTIRRALTNFSGIQRRFEYKGEESGIKIFDDYGHHPTEIRAVLKAARESFDRRRIFVIFQPHRYTRTRDLMDEFAQCFTLVDRLFIMDIYPAGEAAIEGVNSENLLKRVESNKGAKATYIPDRNELVKRIISELRMDDVVITLGAGDVYKVGNQILRELSPVDSA
ncbi:MAG: UDP-N-acetylmuramate--L-alanine ligase [Dissulfurispiraceae bacterium]